jgi:hypothetical protein
VRRFAIGLALVLASTARAADNDLQLFRLGHPNDIRICNICDGSDTVVEAGDPGAQRRFARLVATLGLAFTPPFQEQARTTGQAGFELGVSGAVAFPKLAPNEWPTEGTLATSAAPQQLILPTLEIRKGLGGGFELGAAASYLVNSQMVGLTAELRWAALEGLPRAPDVSLRAFGTRVIGTRELDLVVGGPTCRFPNRSASPPASSCSRTRRSESCSSTRKARRSISIPAPRTSGRRPTTTACSAAFPFLKIATSTPSSACAR